MLAYKFIDKDLYGRRFTWNNLNFLQELFSSTLQETYPGLPQTTKMEKFAVIADD